ncbi:MAG: hypothetical protein HZA10_11315 [Nitrospirae bacterium]|nr:hypothetical protein [Nitrospirota bacterium]
MKRSLIVILGLMFVLGFTVSAFAIHAEIPSETQSAVAKGATQITLGGELRFRGETRNNTADFDKEAADRLNAYDGRVRLNLQADTSKNTTGYLQLESGDVDTNDTFTWGANSTSDLTAAGAASGTATTSSGASGTYTEGNGKRGDLRILQAWIQSKEVIGPIGFKIGHMPIKLGNGLFLDHSKFGDDAIMLFANPTKEVELALVDAKFTEGLTTSNPSRGFGGGNSDDTDAYAFLINYKGSGFNIGADAAYLNDQNFADYGLHLWNYGVRMNSKMGPIGVKADIEIQRGIGKNKSCYGGAGRITNDNCDFEFEGHAYLAGVDFDLGSVVLDAVIASGSGENGTSMNEDNKITAFQTAQGGDQHYTYVYEYRARTAAVGAQTNAVAGGNALGNTGTGISNTTYYKVGATAKPTKDLSANLSLYFLKATKPVVTATNSEYYNSTDIGRELDGKVTYQIDKNLVYFVEGGYLQSGDIYRNLTTNDESRNKRFPDDAYAVRHGVTLSF